MHSLIDRSPQTPSRNVNVSKTSKQMDSTIKGPESSVAASIRPSAALATSLMAIPSGPSHSLPTSSRKQTKVSIMIVTGDNRLRRSISKLLEWCSNDQYDFVVVGEATVGPQTLDMLNPHSPHLVILDVELTEGKMDGLALLEEIQKQPHAPKVVMMSAHQEDDVIFKCMQMGAFGYIPQPQLSEQLYGALRSVLREQVYLEPTTMTAFFRMFHFHGGRSLRTCHSIQLSPREHEVLSFLVEGHSNETIAKTLYISVATVKAHLTSVFEKLSVKSRTQAIVRALRLGLV